MYTIFVYYLHASHTGTLVIVLWCLSVSLTVSQSVCLSVQKLKSCWSKIDVPGYFL